MAIGNHHANGKLNVLASFSKGELMLLEEDVVTWTKQLGSGVVAASFDRPDINMNKFSAVCMDSRVLSYDARTRPPDKVNSKLLGIHCLKMQTA